MPRIPDRRRLVSVRGLGGGLTIGLGLLALAAYVQPAPRRQAGATYCLPVLGPRVSVEPGLSDSARAPVLAHEMVHAAQCRAMGSVRFYLAHWSAEPRMKLEAEAGCAEALQKVRLGRRPDFAFEELVDDLLYAVPAGMSPAPEVARAAAGAACPDLARSAVTNGHA